jgi:Raf kinase inhibitor-like YbhB/YbcL family protein
MIAASSTSLLAGGQHTRPAALTVSSAAFVADRSIPPEYTCDGTQVSPPLSWSAVPKATRSVAVMVDDPDANGGDKTHWLVTGIDPTTQALMIGSALPDGAVAAKNDDGQVGYSGPCPPAGRHRYYFHVYALETTIPAPASKADFLASINGHVLAEGQLMGTYEKATTSTVEPPLPKVTERH